MSRSLSASSEQLRHRQTKPESIYRGVESTRHPWWRCLLPIPLEKTGAVVFLATVMMGLVWSSTNRIQSAQVFGTDEPFAAGIIVRSELLHIWVPETFREVADVQASSPRVNAHEYARRLLERWHQGSLTYAVTVRGYELSGGHADITFVRHPYEEPRYLEEFSDILSRVGGRLNCEAAASFSEVPIHIVPEDLFRRESTAVIAELQQVMDNQQ